MERKLLLKPQTFYRTREGKKAYVASISSPFGNDTAGPYPIIGYAETYGTCIWGETGQYYCRELNDRRDLVAEWQDPLKGEGWVVIFEQGISGIYTKRRDAQIDADLEGNACVVRVKYEEVQE